MISKWSMEHGTGGADTLTHFFLSITRVADLIHAVLVCRGQQGFPKLHLRTSSRTPFWNLSRGVARRTLPYPAAHLISSPSSPPPPLPSSLSSPSLSFPVFRLVVGSTDRVHGPPRTVPCPEGNIVARGPPSLAMTPSLASMAMMSKHCRHRRRRCQRRLIWDEEGAGGRGQGGPGGLGGEKWECGVDDNARRLRSGGRGDSRVVASTCGMNERSIA